MKYLLYLIVLLAAPSAVFSQDITGLWKGTLYNDSTQQSFQYEVVVSKDHGKYSAFSYTWFQEKGSKLYGVKKIKVHVAKDGKIIMQDAELVKNNYNPDPNQKIFQLNVLDFADNSGEPTLDGLFVTNRTKAFHEHSGRITLKRVSAVVQGDLMENFQLGNSETTTTLTAAVR